MYKFVYNCHNNTNLEPEVILELNQTLEIVRQINTALRGEVDNLCNIGILKFEPYNFSAVLKTIKLKYPHLKNEINEIIKTYY